MRCAAGFWVIGRVLLGYGDDSFPLSQGNSPSLCHCTIARRKTLSDLCRAPGTPELASLKQVNKDGSTIVQVTHSEANAAYGIRIVNLKDGRLADAPVFDPPYAFRRGPGQALVVGHQD